MPNITQEEIMETLKNLEEKVKSLNLRLDTAETRLRERDKIVYDLLHPDLQALLGDMFKDTYDANDDGVVDDAEDSQLLDGSTKAEVQTHAPAAHKASHENDGDDEISVAGLSGELADDQPPKSHAHQVVTLTFTIPGDAEVGTKVAPSFVWPTFSGTIALAVAYCHTKPTGADLIFNINIDGTSIWASTPANRLKIVANADQGSQSSFDTTALVTDDKVSLDIDQIGSTVAGADITVELLVTPAAS